MSDTTETSALAGPEWVRMRERISELKRTNAESLMPLAGPVGEFETDDPLLIRAIAGDFAREAIREEYGEKALERLEELCGG